ncbi:carboxylating nicotinate-nucleotide diphosphorylase [Streptomyces mauvecolor]
MTVSAPDLPPVRPEGSFGDCACGVAGDRCAEPGRVDSKRKLRTTRMQIPQMAARDAVALALSEDAAADDVTTRWSVAPGQWATAVIVTRQPGLAAGVPLAAEVYARIGGETQIDESVPDGTRLEAGDVLARISGPAHQIITGERTVLNFLQRLCGIATLTDRYVTAVRDLPVRVLDTRKTAPGLRLLDKYAVAAGGGSNHRLDLAAMVLLKENHIAAAGGVTTAIDSVRKNMASEGRAMAIEVEVATLAQVREALQAEPSWIMLDNMTVPQVAEAVRLRRELAPDSDIRLEASGTITLDDLRAVAETGVDAISVGSLTHSAPAMDLSMLLNIA